MISIYTVDRIMQTVLDAVWHIVDRAVATVCIAMKLIAHDAAEVVAHALAEMIILAAA